MQINLYIASPAIVCPQLSAVEEEEEVYLPM